MLIRNYHYIKGHNPVDDLKNRQLGMNPLQFCPECQLVATEQKLMLSISPEQYKDLIKHKEAYRHKDLIIVKRSEYESLLNIKEQSGKLKEIKLNSPN